MCEPPLDVIVRQIRRALKKVSKEGFETKVFIATDNDPMVDELEKHFRKREVSFVVSDRDDSHVDLAVLGLSNHFIGNCVSSFTAFVKRERDVKGLPSSFWGFPKEKRSETIPPHGGEL